MLGQVILIALVIFAGIAFLGNQFETSNNPYINSYPTFDGVFQFILILTLASLLVTLPFTILLFYISQRQAYLLNHQSLKTVWFKDPEFNTKFVQAFLARVLVELINLPAYLTGGFLIFLGSANFINFVNSQGGSTAQIPAVFSVYGDSLALAFFAFFLGFLLIGVFTSVMSGFLGLTSQLIIQENYTAIEAFKKSFRISKRKYFQNVLRWFLFSLLLSAVGFVSSAIQQMFSFTGQIVEITEGQNNVHSLNLLIITLVFSVLQMIFSLVFEFITTSMYLSFDYVSFYNFRISTLKQVEGDVSLQTAV